MADPYIKLEHITKSFDSVYANKDISVDVYKGARYLPCSAKTVRARVPL